MRGDPAAARRRLPTRYKIREASATKPVGENTRDQRLRYKSALVETLRRDGGDFHVVAQLRAGASRAALEDALYAWVARVNRSYLGRSWSGTAPCQGSYEGIPPRSPCCPSTCHRLFSSLHFMLNARFCFQPNPAACLRQLYPRPVAPRGTMTFMRIGSTEADLGRVMNYVAKRLEAAIDRSGWKFLDELSPRQV